MRRKEIAATKKNKMIEITSDLFDLISRSINLNPSQRGRALHLLNVGAKKRKQPENSAYRNQTAKHRLNEFSDIYESERLGHG